ncbi:MAG: PAS domain S-box protein [Deltaproteobacteria bacterium]|nr:PAS domain S-box protein [Deltaproteobacteria bacterium]
MPDFTRKEITSVFDALMDGVYLIDEGFNVKYMNDVMVEEFGEGMGKKCHQLLHDSGEICPWCRAEEVFAGASVRWEHHIERKNQTYDIIEFPLKDPDGTRLKVSIFRDITKQKRDEARLRASQEDYRRLFEHVGCGVFISTREGKFLNANKALLDMLGYEDKAEFLGMDIARDLYLNPEDRKRFQEVIEREGRVINFEVYFKKKDATPVPVLLTAHARYDEQGKIIGYEGINVDQSERKEMEQRLKEANDFLNKIIQSSPNAIMATDLKGNIILWNRAAEKILGYRAEEVIGRMNIKKIYPEGMAKEVMGMIRSLEYGGKGILRSYPMVHVRRDGEIIEGNLSAAMLYDSGGEEIASVGIFADLKEFLDMERKLRETQEKLLQSEKLAAMGKLTSQIAHELNNPLYGIMNTLELLKSEIPPTSKRRKILDMALSETVRLTELLRKMLSFSKPEEEERQLTDVNQVIDEILLLVKKQLLEKSIRVSSSLADDLGMINASRSQLRQVFLNMIANARDAMPDGGTLTVNTMRKADNIYIEIADTGTGIRKEDLNKIFDAFFTTKDSVKDVGLGLSVCYGFIKDHGGDIRVSSKWGSGTTFTIILPAQNENPADGERGV